MIPHNQKPEDDARLDRLLVSLGSVPAGPGFEQRLLRRLEAHAAPKTHRPTWRRWPLVLAGSLACALIAFVTLRSHPSGRPSRGVLTQPLSAAQEADLRALAIRPLDSLRVTSASHPPATATVHTLAKRFQPRKISTYSAGPQVLPKVLASFPAPPMPLTEQERLMLRILHKGDPEEIAMLNPDVRESLFARDKAEFKEFFKPPPPPPTLNPLHQPPALKEPPNESRNNPLRTQPRLRRSHPRLGASSRQAG